MQCVCDVFENKKSRNAVEVAQSARASASSLFTTGIPLLEKRLDLVIVIVVVVNIIIIIIIIMLI